MFFISANHPFCSESIRIAIGGIYNSIVIDKDQMNYTTHPECPMKGKSITYKFETNEPRD